MENQCLWELIFFLCIGSFSRLIIGLGIPQEARDQLQIILQMDPENSKAQQELAKLSPKAVK